MKNRLTLLGLTGALVALSAVSFAPAKTPRPLKFSAALNIGQVKPHPKGTKAGASGRFTATLSGTTLTWKLTFTHLSGPATASHIHSGAKGVNGPILIPLCASCTSPISGTSTLTTAEIDAMKLRKTYVNVHTARNPGGEIRGQITRAR